MTGAKQIIGSDDEVDQIAEAVEATLIRLQRAGIPADLILGAALATVLTLTADTYGGQTAADVARKGAARVEGLPSYAACPLAAMQPMGRA